MAAALVLVLATLAGCKDEQNRFVAPPPAKVGVSVPLQQAVTPYLELTGTMSAIATVDLVARVEGYLTSINYVDGALAQKDDLLFQIEQAPYIAAFKQNEASVLAAQAQLVGAQAEFNRQNQLFHDNVTAQATLDQARAKRDTDQANIEGAQASLQTAGINLSYTRVQAPFDGIVTRHLVSQGELVGVGGDTKLATIVQLDPIYVMFNLSDQDIAHVRTALHNRRLTLEELQQVPVEVGLMTETGFPHRGHLDYVNPELDPQTSTVLVRGIFENKDRTLLPGMFVRVRVPVGPPEANALLVPDRVLGQSQQGRYLLVVTADDEVEQRPVQVGQLQGEMRVITAGLKPDDRVVVTSLDRAIPGRKVAPQKTSLAEVAGGTITAAK